MSAVILNGGVLKWRKCIAIFGNYGNHVNLLKFALKNYIFGGFWPESKKCYVYGRPQWDLRSDKFPPSHQFLSSSVSPSFFLHSMFKLNLSILDNFISIFQAFTRMRMQFEIFLPMSTFLFNQSILSKSQTFGLGQTNWADKFWGIFRYFRPNYQQPFWYSESLVHVFHYSTIISTKNMKPLYPHPKYTFGIGNLDGKE